MALPDNCFRNKCVDLQLQSGMPTGFLDALWHVANGVTIMLHGMKLVTNSSSESEGSKFSGRSNNINCTNFITGDNGREKLHDIVS